MLVILKLKNYIMYLIKNFCNQFSKFLIFFKGRNFLFFFAIFISLFTFFFLFNEEMVKFMLGEFENTQNFLQNINGFDSSQSLNKDELSDQEKQEKHLRKVNAKLDHQIKTAEEAQYFAQEREKNQNPEFQKFLKEHAFALNVLVFVFCWMVIFNTIAHMPPSSPPPPK